MPSGMLHSYYAVDVYRKLPSKIKHKIDLDTLRVFSQGPDLFYYGINFKNTRAFGIHMHQVKSRAFFEHYVDYMKRYRLEKKTEIISCFYGFLLHYFLDMKIHPLIYYKTGSGGLHPKLERNRYYEMSHLIDLYYMEKNEKIDPRRVKVHKKVIPVTQFSKSLENLLNDVMRKTYHKQGMGTIYLKKIKTTRRCYRIFRYDPYRMKKVCYRIIDRFRYEKISNLSYAIDLRKKASYLNYEHKNWCNPWDGSKVSSASFFELYEEVIMDAIKIISVFHEAFVGKKEFKDCLKKIPDVSYLTGLDYMQQKMKYYEHKR